MDRDRQSWLAFGVLALVLGMIGLIIVPAHSVSIWMDWEFTDWVSPIANRLGSGCRLYEGGTHSPMPPLPFVLVHLIWPHGAHWINASLLNFLFQSGLILLLFYAFAKWAGPATAFVCALMVLPVYLSLPKTILYDSMAQFFAATCGLTVAAAVCSRPAAAKGTASGVSWKWGVLLGLELALLLLTKQNTFAGTLIGVCGALFFLPRAETVMRRCGRIIVTLVATGVFFGAMALALSKWVSVPGLIHDVFVTGSEPKGGSGLLVKRLLFFGERAGIIAAGWWVVLVIFNAVVRWFRPGLDHRLILDSCVAVNDPQKSSLRFVPTLAAALVVSGGVFALLYLSANVQAEPEAWRWGRLAGRSILNLGLALGCFFAACVIFRKLAPGDRDWGGQPMAVCAMVSFASAVFHTLSVGIFRWSYDNNPFVFSALALVVCGVIGISENAALPSFLRTSLMRVVGLGIFLFCFWGVAEMHLALVWNCAASWPEIKHLEGARLRPQSAGTRELVKTVRAHSDAAKRDTVLLLPSDPNLEEWFERGRPRLSCAIVFADQYWDKYVEPDLAELQRNPPQVIVIGPRDYWRRFSAQWKRKLGVERLTDLVIEKLLPGNYELVSEQAVYVRGGKDFMDVYVRRKPGAGTNAVDNLGSGKR